MPPGAWWLLSVALLGALAMIDLAVWRYRRRNV